MSNWEIRTGGALELLRKMPKGSVQCVITSPPYWALRDYGIKGQLGLEKTPEEYVARQVEVFHEVRRVLRADGTCWLNMGDSYVGAPPGNARPDHSGPRLLGTRSGQKVSKTARAKAGRQFGALKPKDLVGMPWRVAFALQADGWWLRRDVIWSKPNCMPESADDRPTTAHEYLFLLTKSARYYYNGAAIAEPTTGNSHPRGNGVNPKADVVPTGWDTSAGGHHGRAGRYKPVSKTSAIRVDRVPRPRTKQNRSFSAAVTGLVESRNKRSVWTIATEPFAEAHFATFPQALVEPCILAGTSSEGCCSSCGAPRWPILRRSATRGGLTTGGKQGESPEQSRARRLSERTAHARAAGLPHDNSLPTIVERVGWRPGCDCKAAIVPCLVLDPFCGSGTVGVVALRHGRLFLGLELSPTYSAMARRRIAGPLFAEAAP